MDWLSILLAVLRPWSVTSDDRCAGTLSRLDAVRAEAFATGDPRRLDEVYVRGSRLRSTDADAIGAYAVRSATVVGAELWILSCRVLSSSADKVRLDVVDQLGSARVVWADGTSRALPRDEPTRRTLTLVHTSHGWRIAAATPRS